MLPSSFVEEMFGAVPDEWQHQFMGMVRDYPQSAVRSGHGVGKDTVISWEIIKDLVTLYPLKIGVTAPTSRQLFDNQWAELGKWHRRMKVFGDQLEWTQTRFFLRAAPDQSFATARTASKDRPEALQGLRADNVKLIANEASGIPDEIFQAAEGTMSQPGAKFLMGGNPTRLGNYFHRAFTSDRGTWQTMRVSCFESSRVDPSYIEKIRTEYGENSNAWRIRVLGEFPLQNGGSLISLDIIERAVGADRQAGGLHAWGLDPGGEEFDPSALTKRCGPVVYSIEEKPGLDEMAQVGWIKSQWDALADSQRPTEINVDATGVGSGVASRLVEIGLPARAIKVGINIRPQRKEETKRWWHDYSNVRAALHYRAKEWMGAGSIPRDQNFIAEASSIKGGGLNSMGQQTIEKKEDAKARTGLGFHRFDSFILTFATGELGIKGGIKKTREDWLLGRTRT